MTYNRSMRVALVHDWLTGMRGGERCLEVFCELFPQADLFTLLHVPGSVSPTIEGRRIVTSFIQRLPAAATRYRQYLPLMPAAVGRFDCPGLRPGAVLQPLRGPGRPPRPREPARVLLLHPHALRVGPLRGLRRRARQPRHASGPARAGPGSARVGPQRPVTACITTWPSPSMCAPASAAATGGRRRSSIRPSTSSASSWPTAPRATSISSSRRSCPTSASIWPSARPLRCGGGS